VTGFARRFFQRKMSLLANEPEPELEPSADPAVALAPVGTSDEVAALQAELDALKAEAAAAEMSNFPFVAADFNMKRTLKTEELKKKVEYKVRSLACRGGCAAEPEAEAAVAQSSSLAIPCRPDANWQPHRRDGQLVAGSTSSHTRAADLRSGP
jgi:hypothetical protein